MTVAERVAKLLRDNPEYSYCDDCIAEMLDLAQRQQANQVTTALAVTKEFLRGEGECHHCYEDRIVIGVYP